MQFKRQDAFVFLLIGLILIIVSIANLAGFTRWVSDRSRFLFMTALLIAGFLLSWYGWTRLSSLKKEKQDQTWWQFLRVELIVLGFLVFFGLGYWLLPRETREAIRKILHDFLEATHAIKSTH